ncbi:MAG: hypothetical protein HC850_17075 [Rhodomicrobium sp.]|nr:hypothetical protein [Rhodomicrobium sp.]
MSNSIGAALQDPMAREARMELLIVGVQILPGNAYAAIDAWRWIRRPAASIWNCDCSANRCRLP